MSSPERAESGSAVTSVPPNPWCLAPDAAGERPGVALYCLPPAGRGAATYRKWPSSMPAGIGVYRIQPPGRENRFREPFCPTLEQYVAAICDAIEQRPAAEIALFGHSMGALLAYEVALALRERTGNEPAHLFVSAFRSPHSPAPEPIHTLPDAEFVAALRERYDAVPDQVLQYPEILEMMLPILRSDLGLLASYRHLTRRRLGCPVTAIGGRTDPWVDERELAEWRAVTDGRFELRMLPGGHFYIDESQVELTNLVAAALGAGTR